MTTPVLELRAVSRRFGKVVACDRVDLAVNPGEVVGLLGQNGAGKSTLMKIVLGLVLPDGGEIRIRGQSANIDNPAHAASLGIAMVHQHFSVIDALTVWENVHLGDRDRLDPEARRAEVTRLSQTYDLAVDPDARVRDLTAAQRQQVEIIKCLRRDPSLIILDEPTSVLTLAQSAQLFAVLRQMVVDEKRAVVLISHKLDEILQATDRVVIMRDGRVVKQLPTSAADAPTLARAMVGREVSLRAEASALGVLEEVTKSADSPPASQPNQPGEGQGQPEESSNQAGENLGQPGENPEGLVAASVETYPGRVALRVRGAVTTTRDGRRLLDGIDLELRFGEILGVAGVEGNGQVPLGDLFSSLLTLDEGIVEVDGQEVPSGEPGAMGAAGVGVIPEDRHSSGCVLDLSLADNLLLGRIHTVSRWGVLQKSRIDSLAAELIERFEIVAPSVRTPFRLLSGGNQQKAVLARELSHSPKVLVAAQPTRGLDVGAVEYMTRQLRAAAADGMAVMLISTELGEILELAHRIAVIYRGRIVGTVSRSEADVDRLSLMMTGQGHSTDPTPTGQP